MIISLLDFLFPKRCISCKQEGKKLCQNCFKCITTQKTQRCYKCGKASLHGQTCAHHLKKNPEQTLDGLLIAAHYEGNPILKNSIKQLKYGRQKDLSKALSNLLSNVFIPFANGHSGKLKIIPVPLHEQREKERGFNQAALLASEVNKIFDQEIVLEEDLLTRSLATLPQAQQTRKNRLQNLSSAFQTTKKADPQGTYLLIDDIITTGSTLESCCKSLRQAGAKKVWGMVLASNR